MEILQAGKLSEILGEEGIEMFLFRYLALFSCARQEADNGDLDHAQCPTCLTWLPNGNPMHYIDSPVKGDQYITARFCTRCETVFNPAAADCQPVPITPDLEALAICLGTALNHQPATV